MHLLHRDLQPPTGLTNYRHGRDIWCGQSPNADERSAIWDKLNAMQGNRCAYCEMEISQGKGHIEHFRQRSRYPQGTFDWANLFGSCDRNGVCGRHKDECGNYPHQDLIKPDVDDPDDYFVFDPQGGIHPKAGLAPDKHRRAKETIRILKLDGGGLPYMRLAAAKGYQQQVEVWAQYAEEFPDEDWRSIVEQEQQNEIARTAHLPFATAIRHTLARVNS